MSMRAGAWVLLSMLCSACSPMALRPPSSPPAPAQETAGSQIPDDGARIAQAAAALIGTTYQFGGADSGGFDCSGLARYAYGRIGLDIPRTAAQQQHAARQVLPQELAPGDLVFFRIGSQRIDHVGIYAGGGRFVHAPRSGESVRYSQLDSEFYARHFVSAGRFWSSPPAAP